MRAGNSFEDEWVQFSLIIRPARTTSDDDTVVVRRGRHHEFHDFYSLLGNYFLFHGLNTYNHRSGKVTVQFAHINPGKESFQTIIAQGLTQDLRWWQRTSWMSEVELAEQTKWVTIAINGAIQKISGDLSRFKLETSRMTLSFDGNTHVL